MVDVFTAPRNALFPGKATRKAPLESGASESPALIVDARLFEFPAPAHDEGAVFATGSRSGRPANQLRPIPLRSVRVGKIARLHVYYYNIQR